MKFKLLLIVMMISLGSLWSASISGYVRNSSNGEKVPFANIVISETGKGVNANEEGYYVINRLQPGSYTVQYSSIGFSLLKKNITIENIEDDKFQTVELLKSSVAIQGLEVSAQKFDNLNFKTKEIVVSTQNISRETITQIADMGEPDVLRSLQNMPGVTCISDFSSGLYVRGGTPDQNLILLDGINVYNPTHFGGIFSTFNSDAVANVELIKGGYPVAYGGKLSSVLKVSNLDGNRKRFQADARVSLISSSATVQGPWKIKNLKGSYMASYRRTYLDLLMKTADILGIANTSEFPSVYFYDGHAKINIDLTPKDFLNLSYYSGKDFVEFDEIDLDQFYLNWGNRTFSANWKHVFSPNLVSNFLLAGSKYESDFVIEEEGDFEDDSFLYDRYNLINDVSIKADLQYKANETHQIRFGTNSKINKISFEEIIKENGETFSDYHPNLELFSFSNSVYLQDSWEFADFWSLQSGFRLNQYYSSSTYLKGKPHKNFFSITPRVSLRKILTDRSSAYFSYGKFYQYLNALTLNYIPLDIWLPADHSIKPSSANHFIAGYQAQFNDNHVLDFEVYYKNQKNITEYKDNSETNWNSDDIVMDDLFNIGKGYSYGAELLLRSQWSGLEGFVSYSYGVTRKKVKDQYLDSETLKPQYFAPKHDRTHSVNIVESYNLTDKTGFRIFGGDAIFNLTYKFGSGQPYKTPHRVINENPDEDEEDYELIYDFSEGKRLNPYHRLDLTIKMRKERQKYTFEPYIQILNVTNHTNEYFISFDDDEDDFDEDGKFVGKEERYGMIPFIPFFGFNFHW